MLAAVDVGTNTARLLLGEVAGNRVRPLHYERRITRLGGGFTPQTGLAPDSCERTLAALMEFSSLLAARPIPPRVRAVGTEALRKAVNGAAFVSQVRSRTGIPLEIITGEEEARLSAAGILSAVTPLPECSLLIDIGGGSTELIACRATQPLFSRSYPIGTVRLCEDFPGESLPQRIEEFVAQACRDLSAANLLDPDHPPVLIGTAGTVTTLAALDLKMTVYDWRRVNNHRLSLPVLEQLLATLEPLSPVQREALPGMEPGRGDLILPGLLILLGLLRRLALQTLVVSDSGLLEGILLDLGSSG